MGSVDRDRIRAAVGEILAALGEDPAREGLCDTPQRVAELYAELFSGVGADPADALGEAFRVGERAAEGAPDVLSDDSDGAQRVGSVVLMRDLAFRSVCEHHLLPFEGIVHIAYEPDAVLAGLGRFAAVVESASSRPQLQERLGDDIAEAIERGLGARGVLVVIDARHGCVTARGPRQTASTTVTVSARGTLAEPAARAEVLTLAVRG